MASAPGKPHWIEASLSANQPGLPFSVPVEAAGLGHTLDPLSLDTLPVPDAVFAVLCYTTDLSRDHESVTAA